MDLKKAKMAEKKKVKVERVKQEVEEEVVEEDLELEFDTDLEEEVEDVIEEQSVEERLKKVEAPKVRESKQVNAEKNEVAKIEKKTSLKRLFEKENASVVPNKVTCEVSAKDRRLWILSGEEDDNNTLSGFDNFYIEYGDITVFKYCGTTNNKSNFLGFKTASNSCDKMNWGYAFAVCSSRNLSLPTKQQFNLIYQAKKNGCDMGFLDDEYWINTETPNKASVCSMATGQCREVDLVETMKTELHRVRCVD